MTVTSYVEADALLGSRTSRKIANHTYVQRRDRDIAVRYHDTDVVTYHPPGVINGAGYALDTGTWLTESTRNRMNTFTPREVQVFTTKGRWYVTFKLADKGGLSVPDYASAVAYADRILIYPGEIVYGYLDDAEVAAQDRHNRQVNRLIDRWLKHLDGRNYPGVECALCVNVSPGVLVGDKFQQVTHLIDHLTNLEYPYGLIRAGVDARFPQSGARSIPPAWRNPAVRSFLRQRLYTGPVSLAHGRRPQFAPTWGMTRRSA